MIGAIYLLVTVWGCSLQNRCNDYAVETYVSKRECEEARHTRIRLYHTAWDYVGPCTKLGD